MAVNVLHTIFCDKASREDDGKLTCKGIFEAVGTDTFPVKVNFSIVAWLNGVNGLNNKFTVRILDKDGKIRGTKAEFSVPLINRTGMEEWVFHFNDFALASISDCFIIELIHTGKVISRKTLRAVPAVKPIAPIDRGFIDL